MYSKLENQVIEKSLHANRKKLEEFNQANDFTQEERILIQEGFKETTGHDMPSNCTKCYPKSIKILRNWFKLYDRRVIEPVKKPLKKIKDTVLVEVNIEPLLEDIAKRQASPVQEITGVRVEDLVQVVEEAIDEMPEESTASKIFTGKIDAEPKENFKPKTVKDYKEALKHMGVKLPHNATKPQLKALWDENN